MNTKLLIARACALIVILATALVAPRAQAQVTVYNDATNDISGSLGTTGDGTLDIVKMEVTDSLTDVIFSMTVNGNISTTSWGKFMVGISTTNSPGTIAGNAWGRPINLSATWTNSASNGMTHWIGSWVDGGSGSQFWSYDGTNWTGPAALTSFTTTPGSNSIITYTVPKASLGVALGDTIYFDAYSSGGGGTDSAVDALSNTNPSITGWGQTYTTANPLISHYTLSNSALNVTTDVTFSVDMNAQIAVGTFDPATDFVVAEWGASYLNSAVLSDPDFDGIYTGTGSVSAPDATPVGYRYSIEPWSGLTPLTPIPETVSRSFTMQTTPFSLSTVYFDNIQGYRDVTFTVDMSVQTALGLFNPATQTVDVRGSFNGWAGGTTLTAVGDGTYSVTVRIGGIAGATESYKYVVGTSGYESIPNRTFALALNSSGSPTPADVLPTVYFNNESTVPANRPVTFSVNMSVQEGLGNFTTNDTVEVRGSFNTWSGGAAYQLTNTTNGVYVGTFTILGAEGTTNEYKFWNSHGGSTWENIPNRSFVSGPTNTNQVLSTVYFDDNSGQSRDVTFSVDMSLQIARGLFSPGTQSVQVRGGFNSWAGTAMTNVSGGVYSATIPMAGDEGSQQGYKFYSTGGLGYEIIDPNDSFVNRTVTLGPSGTPQLLSLVYFSNQLFYATGTPLSAFSTTSGTASAAQFFTLIGMGLGTNNITATAPSSFEVSTDGLIYGATAEFVPSAGSVSNSVWARIAASAPVGSPSGSIALTATNALSSTVAVAGTVAAPSGSTFTNWAQGAPLNSTNQLIYAIGGASSPTATNGVVPASGVASNSLYINAVIRTNDPNLTVLGQSILDLTAGVWTTNDVTVTADPDQTGVPEGCQKRIFSTPRETPTKKFLRLDTILTQ